MTPRDHLPSATQLGQEPLQPLMRKGEDASLLQTGAPLQTRLVAPGATLPGAAEDWFALHGWVE